MFRKVDPPVYTNVYSDAKGVFGVVEYNSHRELRQVMSDMRGSEFKNPFCDPTPVYLLDDTDKEDQDAAGSLSPRSDRRQRSPSRTRDRRSRSRCALAVPLLSTPAHPDCSFQKLSLSVPHRFCHS
jgi:hypothetical protein